MKERRYVKFKVDMLSDTKSKIIDMKPERDLIHYVWMAFVLLAGKVNLEGDLYMSKNIPYTLETLAIEFNRGIYQVKLALDVLMELEMIEITENNVYRVRNFAKHQNIKVKQEKESNNKNENIKKNEVKENLINEVADKPRKATLVVGVSKDALDEVAVSKDEITEKKINKDKKENLKGNPRGNLNNNIPIPLESKEKKELNKCKKKELCIETIDKDIGDNINDCFYEGDEIRPLEEGESVVNAWSFK